MTQPSPEYLEAILYKYPLSRAMTDETIVHYIFDKENNQVVVFMYPASDKWEKPKAVILELNQ